MTRTLSLFLGLTLFVFLPAEPASGQTQKKPATEPIKDKKLAGIVKDLKHKDAKNRAAALQELLQMAEVRPSDVEPAMPYVLPMLKDTDANVRSTAITILDTLATDPKQFAPALVELLKKEKDSGVRFAAVVAAGHLGPAAAGAVPALEALLKSIKDNPKEKLLATEVNAALRKIKAK